MANQKTSITIHGYRIHVMVVNYDTQKREDFHIEFDQPIEDHMKCLKRNQRKINKALTRLFSIVNQQK